MDHARRHAAAQGRSIAPIAALALTLVFAPGTSVGAVSGEYQAEIEYLLGFVQGSACEFERNGKIYDGGAAASHIRKKYRFFHDRIDTTEQFIEWSASKSTISGSYYRVKCGDEEWTRTRDWLIRELQNFRRDGNT